MAPAEDAAYNKALQQLQQSQKEQSEQLSRQAAQGGPEASSSRSRCRSPRRALPSIAQELAPTVSSVAKDTLKDPVNMVSKAYNDLPDGTALGMSASTTPSCSWWWASPVLVALNLLILHGRDGHGALRRAPSSGLPRAGPAPSGGLPHEVADLRGYGRPARVRAHDVGGVRRGHARAPRLPGVPARLARDVHGLRDRAAVAFRGGSVGMLLAPRVPGVHGPALRGRRGPAEAVPGLFRPSPR
ncbi:hypothetical protein QJS66_12230 [Kocuria rhizophila]|nr:hypothetical protein QJS66_12230 [Kocuria rhizophila]